MAECKHDRQLMMTLRLETEEYKRQPDGSLKSDPYFDSEDMEVATKCADCGKVLSVTDLESLRDLIEKATDEFFDLE